MLIFFLLATLLTAAPLDVRPTFGTSSSRSKKPVADVKEFGASCDSKADDTAAIQAALDAAASLQGVVRLSGMCRITSPLRLPLNVSMVGLGPKFGAGILADKTQALVIAGDRFAAGFVFRIYFDDLMIRVTEQTASLHKPLIEIRRAYSIQFTNVWIQGVPDSTTAIDITDANNIGLTGLVVSGRDGAKNAKGVVTHGAATVRLIRPDLEQLYVGIENNDSSVLDVMEPYLERNIIGVTNNATDAGRTTILGGFIGVSNGSGHCIYTPGPHTFVFGTKLDPGTGKNRFGAGKLFNGFYHDTFANRIHLGSVASAGPLEAPSLLSLNQGAQQGEAYGITLGPYSLHIGSAETFAGDLNFESFSASSMTARFFGSRNASFNLYTDGMLEGDSGLKVGRSGTPIRTHLSLSSPLKFQAFQAHACNTATLSFPGAADADTVAMGVPNALAALPGLTLTAWVSASNVVSVRGCNASSADTAEPPSVKVRIDLWQH
jgi:hypothetical protein